MGIKKCLITVAFILLASRPVVVSGQADPARPGPCLMADNLPISFECAYRLGRPDVRTILSTNLRTPAGRQQAIDALQSSDPDRVIFAARFLALSTDFEVIRPLLNCAVRHGENAGVLKEAVGSVESIMGDWGGWGPPALRRARRGGPSRLRDYYLKEDTRWKGTTYAEHHGNRLLSIMKRLPRNNLGKGREMVVQLWDIFVSTDGAQHAAPVVVDCIMYLDPMGLDRDILREFMVGLQLYVGPLDIPVADDAAEYQRAQEKIKSWWEQNKGKSRVCWLLDRLAARGYEVRNPSAVEETALAVQSALKRGTDVERYAAASFLAETLPDGASIVAPRFPFSELDAPKSQYQTLLYEHLATVALARAQRWYLIDCRTMEWNAERGKYLLKCGGLGAELEQ